MIESRVPIAWIDRVKYRLHDIYIQWNLTYPDTSVPRLTVRLTEFQDKCVTFC